MVFEQTISVTNLTAKFRRGAEVRNRIIAAITLTDGGVWLPLVVFDGSEIRLPEEEDGVYEIIRSA